jgi:hypothetical protein
MRVLLLLAAAFLMLVASLLATGWVLKGAEPHIFAFWSLFCFIASFLFGDGQIVWPWRRVVRREQP